MLKPTMARILDFFLNRSTGQSCKAFPDHESLISGLRQENPTAVQCLSSKIAGNVYKIGKGFNLVDEDIEELQCDCILIFMDKLKKGQFEYQGYSPAAFVIEIARKRVRFFARQSQKRATQDLDKEYDPVEEEPSFPGSQLRIEQLSALFKQIGENCQKLIQIHYLDELKDKEVIEKSLTQYTTVDALKNHRAKCMKKLVELAKALKNRSA
jgi:DNA-directed RNA polymerase specialized sigma24 family protein